MKKKKFLEELGNNKGKDLVFELENEIIQKATMEKFRYEIKEDMLYIRSSQTLDLAVVNLNTIRYIKANSENITMFIEDNKDTKIKISVI